MVRFIMPDPSGGVDEIKKELRQQFRAFLESDALRELLDLLQVDSQSLKQVYNSRLGRNGRVLETQELAPMESLEEHRRELYSLLRELGFFDINEPVMEDYNRIAILGGSLNVCNLRTECARDFIHSRTVSVDALTCFRPINPVERRSSYVCATDTEFGVLSEAFARVFEIRGQTDEFTGDRNLNRISCVRTFRAKAGEAGDIRCGIYAAPSTQPEKRRADTGDSLRFYFDRGGITEEDRILFVTSNRYCNRQFLQLAHPLLEMGKPVRFDIIGCLGDDRIFTADTYDPLQYLQDLIGILDWIERFRLL